MNATGVPQGQALEVEMSEVRWKKRDEGDV